MPRPILAPWPLVALLVLPWASTSALALPPNATPGLFEVGSGTIDRLQISDDGALVVGRDRSSHNGWLLFIEDWSTHTLTLCNTAQTRGVAVVPYADGTWEIWVACSDGNLRVGSFDGKTVSTVYDSEDKAVVVPIASALSGVWYDPVDLTLYALTAAGDNAVLHVVDVLTLEKDAAALAGYPLTLPWSGFGEGILHEDALYVHHTGSRMTTVWLGANPVGTPSLMMGLNLDISDIAPSPSGGVFAIDKSGVLAEYLPINHQFQIRMTDLTGPQGVVASLDPQDSWVVVTGTQIKVWEIDSNGLIVGGKDDYYWASAPNLDNAIQDALVLDGYLFGGGTGGRLHVSTARPWVYPKKISVSPEAATDGDVVTLTFTVSQPGNWEVRRGGSRYGNGALLRSGTATSPDAEVSVELTVDQSWAEGDNALYVIHKNLTNPLTGHARTTIYVDNPPEPPNLTGSNLGFGDGALLLSFPGIPDGDLDRYEVYVSTTGFDGASYPTGGPDYDGSTRLTTPITVRKGPGESVSLRIQPLENYVKHYVAVRAWDKGGLEGPMSRVVSETPRPSFTAGQLAGETGGTPCSTTPLAVGWLALSLGAAGVARRRRAGAAAALVAAGMVAAAPAHAAKNDDTGDLTPIYGNFEVRYGVMTLDDDNIKEIYNKNPHNMLQVEFGPQIARVFEIDLGLGFFQELSNTIDRPGGVSSADKTMLTMWPFMVGGTFRLQLLDEQLIVPHIRAGIDYVIYSELSDDGMGGKNALRGAKMGNHWGLGAGLLLDFFAPRRASLLEAQTGINDTYLQVEWRRQNIDGRSRPWGAPVKQDSFDFSGSMFTVGIKLDY